jgi:hypothetical protein
VISAAENSNKFQKIRFWREKSVEEVVKLEGLPINSSMISFHNGFTLGPTAQATLVYL